MYRIIQNLQHSNYDDIIYLERLQKSNSKFRKFEIITTRDASRAMVFETLHDANNFIKSRPTTLHFEPLAIDQNLVLK